MQTNNTKNKSSKSVIIIIIVIILLLLAIFFLWNKFGKSGSKNTSSSNDPVVEKRIYDVSSTTSGVGGKVGLEIRESGAVKANYFLKFVVDLQPNWVCRPNMEDWACVEIVEYNYAGDLIIPSEPDDDSQGSFSAFYCNFDANPTGDELFDTNYRGWVLESCGGTIQTGVVTTNHFNTIFSETFDSIDAFLESTTFNVHSAQNFWEAEDATTSFMNTDRAVAETDPVKSYKLVFSIAN